MRTLFRLISSLCLCLIFAGQIAYARADRSLYDDLGGEAGVAKIVSGLMVYTLQDGRIAHTFEQSNVPRIEKLIVEQVCALTGGSCVYSGQDMRRTHHGLGITTAHFNALVENLQKSMKDQNIPFRTQNKLIALLAPMHGDVIGKTKIKPKR